jgi:hypothetical protein
VAEVALPVVRTPVDLTVKAKQIFQVVKVVHQVHEVPQEEEVVVAEPRHCSLMVQQ